MDNKNAKKKESIEDILSDLNGLLNKMPSILDGIKMPEIKPVDFNRSAQARGPAGEPAEPVRLEPASEVKAEAPAPGIESMPLTEAEPLQQEMAARPGQDLPSPDENKVTAEAALPPSGSELPFDGDKTVIISSLSTLPEGAAAPEQALGELTPQSLGDFMFGENAESSGVETEPPPASVKLEGIPLEPPAAKAKPENKAASFSISELTPPVKDEGTPAGEPEEAGLKAPAREEELSFTGFEAAIEAGPGGAEDPENLPASGLSQTPASAADFGIPDIDALLQLSESRPAGAPASGPAAEPVPLTPAKAPEAASDDLAEFEKQLSLATPQEPGPGDNDLSSPQAAAEPEPAAAPQDFSAFTIEPAPPAAADDAAAAPAPEQAGEPAADREETAAPEQAAPAAGEQAEVTGQQQGSGGIMSDASVGGEPPVPADSGETIRLEPAVDASAGGINFSDSPAQEGPAAENTIEFSNGASAEPQLSAQEPVPEAESVLTLGGRGEDKTIVMPPPGAAAGAEGEGHLNFQTFVAAGITSRAKMSDLVGLSEKQVPEGIPEERVRPLFFLYSHADKALCATLMAELDSVCLKSQTSPMYVKRAGVKGFDTGMNANFIHQMVTDSGAVGLVCVGGIPPESVSEMENVFSSSGSYYKHFDAENFSRTAVLDLLLELILR
ncbi:MAG: hypothetical protein NTY45_05410 [Elusimicrobia bacterium]|nr:hypothetical protein [Elusimicrobiota bacterium]